MQKNQVLLAIDTAGPRLQLALITSDHVDDLVRDIAKGHAEIIFDQIDKLLKRNQLAYKDLTRLAVTTGPGSFTGLRIGLSAARGLGLSLDIPVIGIPTLLAMSLSVPVGQEFTILVDARRKEAYFQQFSAPGVPATPPSLLPMDKARTLAESGKKAVEPAFADIKAMAKFALLALPKDFPPDPAYIRKADAKPQTKGRIEHASQTAT